MSAVIRIKRHISEEPQTAFILNCKKRKTDDAKQSTSASSETSTVLKFAGTVNQDTDITEHIAKITKEEAKDIVNRKRPEANVKDRVDQNREKSQQNRFKIVNYTRALNETSEEFTDANQKLTIVDVEKDRTNISLETSQAATSSAQASSYSDIADEPYVYDIYLADASENAIQYPDSVDLNDLSILEYNDYLYSRPRLVNSDSDDDNAEDDEDSNDENNWRNEYPDEDPMSDNESIGERDMLAAMNNCEIGNDLSSEEEDQNGFVYSIDSEAINFEDDLDYCDVNRYGEAYARYKKRVLRELEDGTVDSGDDDDDEDEQINDSGEDSFHSD